MASIIISDGIILLIRMSLCNYDIWYETGGVVCHVAIRLVLTVILQTGKITRRPIHSGSKICPAYQRRNLSVRL